MGAGALATEGPFVCLYPPKAAAGAALLTRLSMAACDLPSVRVTGTFQVSQHKSPALPDLYPGPLEQTLSDTWGQGGSLPQGHK